MDEREPTQQTQPKKGESITIPSAYDPGCFLDTAEIPLVAPPVSA